MHIRPFAPADAEAVNRVALAAWRQYADRFSDWDRLAAFLSNAAALSAEAELIVATDAGSLLGVVGVVAYVPPTGKREDIFPAQWALIRMLSVLPEARGTGIGRQLAEACIARARRDGAATIGLHTSPVMDAALRLYLRLGFEFERTIPDRHEIPYAVYGLRL